MYAYVNDYYNFKYKKIMSSEKTNEFSYVFSQVKKKTEKQAGYPG